MRHTGSCAALIICFLLNACPSISISADENITILKYSLKPVECDKSGCYVKTRWNLFVLNEAERPVKFVVRIFFVDKFNNQLEQVNKKY